MKTSSIYSLILLLGGMLYSCGGNNKHEVQKKALMPFTIISEGDKLYSIIEEGTQAEILGSGYAWTEGPLWIEEEEMLLFSEIPANKVHFWKEGSAPNVYLHPAGLTSNEKRGGEVGSNGLLLDPNGMLVLCQHGDRRLARMLATLDAPAPDYEDIVSEFKGKPFNSPNDAVFDTKGNLYFTDPPYGLEYRMDDPKKAIDFQGVYKLNKEGDLRLLLDSITRPNGIAFFPDEKRLIIANSDPEKPIWYFYILDENKGLKEGRIFYDASEIAKNEAGLPDGLKIMKDGTVIATGPGGIWFFGPEGVLLGRLKFSELVSNVALNKKENFLFVTADSYVLRIPLK
ncbi:SMP-30/gluconolactonase/LRE family protein [uncultured Cyclobacterium sp.]|uniref:SMP-30/gluconolactonase/LRE family protein n=1 Tax=uncultured Cyclobacterium sp. TaxID=453820 RepID=UPI0030ECDC86|tara:strand:+ start:134 stop:1159 length:1026 start_codon:yes stop_codon:yes gene_type:complete